MTTEVLNVPDISCEHCVKTINGTLGKLAGVGAVATDIPSKTVTLTYDPAVIGLDKIEAELEEVGYSVAP